MRLNPETSMSLCIKAFLIGTITEYTLPLCWHHSVSNTVIGNAKLLANYPTLDRRIQKMGSYCGAVMEIKRLLKIPEYKKLLPFSHSQRLALNLASIRKSLIIPHRSHHRFTKLYKSQKAFAPYSMKVRKSRMRSM